MIVSMTKKKCFENCKTTNQSTQPPVIVTRFVYSKQYSSIVHASLKVIVVRLSLFIVQPNSLLKCSLFSGQRRCLPFIMYCLTFVCLSHSFILNRNICAFVCVFVFGMECVPSVNFWTEWLYTLENELQRHLINVWTTFHFHFMEAMTQMNRNRFNKCVYALRMQ